MKPADIRFDSTRLPASQRLRRWQEFVGDHLAGVDMRRPSDVAAPLAYSGTMSLRICGDTTFAHVQSANHLLLRTFDRIRRADRETVLINIVRSGELLVSQEGRCARLRTGDMCLYESVRPYEIAAPGPFEALVVMADRQSIETSLGNLRLLTGIPILASEGAGAIASRFWQDFASRIDGLDGAAAGRLVRAGFDIAGAALAPASGQAVPYSLASDFTLQRAKMFMSENFHRPGLSPGIIAASVGVSVRRLQELFQAGDSTVTAHLRRLRLDAARRRLAEPALARHSITFIMESAGFTDQAHFSRLFRTAFGLSPREFRSGARRS
ncbi:MAG: helix-turn-helix domain-containing protein [Beijerinckiaceae bacterium]|jgi:AraC-like DNA-binding protein